MTRRLAPIDTIVFDLDGTLYRGQSPIRGAADALRSLRRSYTCRILSNNAAATSASIATRLRELGFEAALEEIVTSADLVLHLVGTLRPKRALVLAHGDLAPAIAARGYRVVDDASADLVIVGVDPSFSGPRLVSALHACLRGATLVATNEDPIYPAADGWRPGAGAYVGFFRGMGFDPDHFCGKPDESAVRTALRSWGIEDARRCLFVGDNLHSDVVAASRVGAQSVLVSTGLSTPEDAASASAPPDAIIESVADLPCLLQSRDPRPRTGLPEPGVPLRPGSVPSPQRRRLPGIRRSTRMRPAPSDERGAEEET